MDERIVRETHEKLQKKGMAKATLAQYGERLKARNLAAKKRDYEERKIQMRSS